MSGPVLIGGVVVPPGALRAPPPPDDEPPPLTKSGKAPGRPEWGVSELRAWWPIWSALNRAGGQGGGHG